MRVLGLGPPYIHMDTGDGALVFSYAQEDLEAWALARKVSPREGLAKLWGKQEAVVSLGNAIPSPPSDLSSTSRR